MCVFWPLADKDVISTIKKVVSVAASVLIAVGALGVSSAYFTSQLPAGGWC
ncbi:hypothetical protein HMPREF0058_1507 [Actinomyces urogenitalis DSM 15434]|uniref:Uncharacterized protein n=1 Tax=Actinomyces urogenitalis DSM 15434 TaxID=525246 RepID=C0W6L3_9ACTO|nr:hypothetical protein HMPREF0058_1507 [Actinomyces urogenitalis DSM 15434]